MYSQDILRNPVKLNRPLNESERRHQLWQHRRQEGFDENYPHYQLSVIQFNSTFLEIVDRNYPVRGTGTAFCLFAMAFSVAMFLMPFSSSSSPTPWEFSLFMWLMSTSFFLGFLWLFLREAFSTTHTPIRLNRRNRKVYVWRKRGLLVVPWDELFFFAREYKDSGLTCWDLRANVLSPDGKKVIDSFPLSSYDSSELIDVQLHFEYFRRYMEEGVEQPYRMLKVCLPLAKRYETWWEGCMRLLLNMHGHPIGQIIFSPFWLVCSLGRFIAMRTSKIPLWPAWVEAECAVDPDDLYRRESGWVAPKANKA